MTRLATLDPAGGAAFRDRRIRTVAAGLAALYLWFVSAQPVVGYAHAGHDDELFLRLAEYIVNGQWLGPYSQFTLMKGCGYPLFIAGVFKLGLPLPLAEHSFYLLGCWLLVRALRPLLRHDAWSLAAFALLLWQPMSYYLDRGGGNILRQNLSTPLTLLVFAGLVALHTRRGARFAVQLGWTALLGLSLGWLWLTREDSVWIGPSVALLVVLAVYFAWREKTAWRRLAWPLASAAAAAVLPVLIVCRLNAKNYGWFGTVEFRAPQFIDAYGALARVQVAPPIDRVPLPRESRRAIYAVSPSFARLQPLFEGPVARWVSPDLQIGGAVWVWALRDAVVDTIHPRNAAETLAFYQQLADEVNAACDAGRIPAGPRHDSFLPPLTPHYLASLRQDLPWYLRTFVQFEGFNARPRRSSGNALELRLFRDLTHSPLAPADDAPEIAMPLTWADRVWRIGALQDIGRTLRWLCVTAEAAGLMAWLWVAGRALCGRRAPEYLWWLATTALGGALAVFTIALLVHVTSWPDWRPLRMAQGYPLLLLFAIASLAAGMKRITLETGRCAGALLMIAGLGLSLAALLYGQRHGFGSLAPTVVLRWVIPGGTLPALCCQVGLSSFSLSVLGLNLSRE